MRLPLLVCTAVGLASVIACRQRPVRKAMLDNVDLIGLVLRSKYAPEDYKRERFQWNLDDELKRARSAIGSAPSLNCREYQQLVRQIFHSARDYHALAIFNLLETKRLPFSVGAARDQSGRLRYFILHVEDSVKDRIRLGAELTRFGSEEPDVAVARLMSQIGQSSTPSDHALATLLLTTRTAEAGIPIPEGSEIAIVLDSSVSMNVPWEHADEQLKCDLESDRALTASALSSSLAGYPLGQIDNFRATEEADAREAARTVLGRMVVHPLYRFLRKLEGGANRQGLASKESFFPPLGNQVWVEDPASPYYAYVYEVGGVRIGLLRIADFLHETGAGDAEVAAFRKIIRRMERTTKALVIDQFNNPGGSLLHLYALASLLSPRELTVPRHRVTLDRREAFDYALLRQTLSQITTEKLARKYREENADVFGGYPFTLKEVREFSDYATFAIKEFERLSGPSSLKVLTDAAALMGIEEIAPTPHAYSKPILLLVNELDFSGADFFPAIMQDSKRATLMGLRTAGAGGYIMQMSHFNPFGIAGFSITSSLAIRKDGKVLENNGVEPDVAYQLSVRDLQYGYPDLVKEVNRNVLKLLGS